MASEDARREQGASGGADTAHLAERVALYEVLFNKLNQEGDAIWNRFNIMLAISLAGLTGWAYIYLASPRSPQWKAVAGPIVTGGLVALVWSHWVLSRLWWWHQHWRAMLHQIEASFPERAGWPRAHHGLGNPRFVDPGVPAGKGLWFRNMPFTHPFLWILGAAWAWLAWLTWSS